MSDFDPGVIVKKMLKQAYQRAKLNQRDQLLYISKTRNKNITTKLITTFSVQQEQFFVDW